METSVRQRDLARAALTTRTNGNASPSTFDHQGGLSKETSIRKGATRECCGRGDACTDDRRASFVPFQDQRRSVNTRLNPITMGRLGFRTSLYGLLRQLSQLVDVQELANPNRQWSASHPRVGSVSHPRPENSSLQPSSSFFETKNPNWLWTVPTTGNCVGGGDERPLIVPALPNVAVLASYLLHKMHSGCDSK